MALLTENQNSCTGIDKEDTGVRVLVLGVGNDLLSDEGIGVHVAREIGKTSLPGNVTVYDGGVMGIDLLGLIEQHDRVVIIDSVEAGAIPGAVFRFNPGQVRMILKEHKTSLHQVDLLETIKIARFLGFRQEIVIIGIQPKTIDWGLTLSPELSDRLPCIMAQVISEIDSLCSTPLGERSEANEN